MELCEGGDVEKLLNEQPGRGLEAELLWKFYEQLTQGVQAIHEADLIHLDLKPANCAYHRSTANSTERGCSTLDPRLASSSISSKVICFSCRAPSTMRGSVV